MPGRGVQKGKVFQELLAALRRSGACHSQTDLSARPEEGQAADADGTFGLGRSEWVAMQAQADALRKLVRIKLADDNDLQAAQCALAACNEFFSNLATVAQRGGQSQFDVLQSLAK